MAIEDSPFILFTVCNLAYLPKALVLAESTFTHTDTPLRIYIFDKKQEIDLPEKIAKYIWIEDCNIPKLKHLAFKYDITEFSTSLKAFIALQLLESSKKIIFLDPDTWLLGPIDSILIDLDQYPIVLTPHFTSPLADPDADGELAMMRFGSFNLGFFAVNNSEQGKDFLKWLNDRCRDFCFFETQFGLSTDQKWVSIAPCLFKNLHVTFNIGLNVAFWNVHERIIVRKDTGKYLVNGTYPLTFFHFSSFDESNPTRLTKRPMRERDRNREDLKEICISYNAELIKWGSQNKNTKYAFDYMTNGDYISPTLRRAYTCAYKTFPSDHDPFDSNGVIGKFATKNHLVGNSSKMFKPEGYGEIKANAIKFKIVFLFMRILLQIIGPNQFFNLSRLFVYLSSYRQLNGLWKT